MLFGLIEGNDLYQRGIGIGNLEMQGAFFQKKPE
jgi:hypothetical protein